MAVEVGERGLFHQNLDFMYKPHFMYKAGVALKLPYPKPNGTLGSAELKGRHPPSKWPHRSLTKQQVGSLDSLRTFLVASVTTSGLSDSQMKAMWET